jgi:hypothetical protein
VRARPPTAIKKRVQSKNVSVRAEMNPARNARRIRSTRNTRRTERMTKTSVTVLGMTRRNLTRTSPRRKGTSLKMRTTRSVGRSYWTLRQNC